MIVELLKENKFDDAIKLLVPKENIDSYIKEFNNGRDLRDTQVGKRKDKVLKNKTVKVAKIPVPFQKKIVQYGAVFLFGSPVNISSNSNKHSVIIDAWDKLRLNYLLLKFAEAVKSETEAAIVFFPREIEGKAELRCRLLTAKNGILLPYFDEYGDMTAFGWKYKAFENGTEFEFMYLFTAETIFVLKNENGWKQTENTKPNLFGKIPVLYLSQDEPEWWKVKELIDRYEMNLSKFADTNDYFASPMYKAKGAVKSMPSKDDTGKIIKLDIIETDSGKIIEADLDVISWDRAPEALKLEFETTKDLIHGMTDTPDLSFNNVKGIGNVSGVALQLMFLGSILKAKMDEGDYNIAVIRCLKILIAGLARVTKVVPEAEINETNFKIQFTSILPDNLKEIVETIMTATGKPILSQKTGVRKNPLVMDSDIEISQLNEESKIDSFNLTE